jgi:hypothetical protein
VTMPVGVVVAPLETELELEVHDLSGNFLVFGNYSAGHLWYQRSA